MSLLIENGFNERDSFDEGRALGILDAEAGIPNRFLMGECQFSRGYKTGFSYWIKQNEEERKKKEKEFRFRCPGYGKQQN